MRRTLLPALLLAGCQFRLPGPQDAFPCDDGGLCNQSGTPIEGPSTGGTTTGPTGGGRTGSTTGGSTGGSTRATTAAAGSTSTGGGKSSGTGTAGSATTGGATSGAASTTAGSSGGSSATGSSTASGSGGTTAGASTASAGGSSTAGGSSGGSTSGGAATGSGTTSSGGGTTGSGSGSSGGSTGCPPPGNPLTAIYVDPVNGSDSNGTGVQTPPSCAFKTLTHGLSLASNNIMVEAIGGSPANPAVFNSDGGESFPLTIATGVTLTTDIWRGGGGASSAAAYQIQLDTTNLPNILTALYMDHGSLQGFTVEIAPTGSAHADGLRCDDAAAGSFVVADCVFQGPGGGNGVPGNGIRALGGCGANLTNVTVQQFATGVHFETSSSSPNFAMTGCDLSSNLGPGLVLSATNVGSASFGANRFHGNDGPQISVAGSQIWNLSGPNSFCDGGQNEIYCYADGGVGLDATNAQTGMVSAEDDDWEHAAPTVGVDYQGTVAWPAACAPITTCDGG
ncbi:MAG: hypothetical protein ACYDCL_04150 [Myxococcales bacterium]